MNLTLKTSVSGHYRQVMDRFDRDLFEALKPPLGKMEIVEFTGSKTGDRVHLQFLSPIRTEWVSIITDHGHDQLRAYFVDEGETLPFPLKSWKHRHIVETAGEDRSVIIDDIYYSSGNQIADLFLYPFLLAAFFPRKRIYRQYFGA